jgi:hypothetical protein
MKRRIALLVAAISIVGLAAAAPALALGGSDFGAHVSDHARMMSGFSATMNPGMHQGFSGWMGGM